MIVPATRFEAWSTYVFLATRAVRDLGRAERLARRVLDDVEETCSRFRDDSDLSRVNRHAGSWVEVDPLLVHAVEVALEAARQSDGLVDPLLGRPLVELGYDRDLGLLTDDPAAVSLTAPVPGAWRGIELAEGALRIPPGTALDLGSSGKAWTADLIGTAYATELDGAALVSLGGDVRVSAPDGSPWPVAVSERPDGPVGTTVHLDAGGLATSSTRVRRWSRGGARHHHLLDPRTGRPAAEVWSTVTAVGPTCVAANTLTTAAVVLGADAPGWLAGRSACARLVARDGAVHVVGGWPADTPAPAPGRRGA